MQEIAIVHNLLREIEAQARDRDALRVVAVVLRMGSMSGTTAARLRDHFNQEARDSVAEDALLEIIEEDNPSSPFSTEVRLERIDIE